MEARSLLLSFRDLSFFCLFMLNPYSLCYKYSWCLTFIFYHVRTSLSLLFPRLQSLLLFCGNWGGLLLSPPSLFSSSYPSCLYSLFMLPFLLLFTHPHLRFSFIFLSCMQPCSTPLYFPTLFFSALHHVACFCRCESCSVRLLM